MPTFRLRRFSRPEVLRQIEPSRLLQFLAPHRDYLALRGLALPPADKPSRVDHDQLIQIFMQPNSETPGSLIDALSVIDELATPDGMDAVLAEAETRGLALDLGADTSPADVVIAAWLADPNAVEQRHAEQQFLRRRSFEHFQTGRATIPEFRPPSKDLLQGIEATLDDWFESRQRGRDARVFMFPRGEEVWFMVRHGDVIRREGSLGTDTVCYRPVCFDHVVYNPQLGELRVNARSQGEKRMYRRNFGEHLFGDADFFLGETKYSLEPLCLDGQAALTVADIDGIDWVRLVEIHYLWDSPYRIEVHKADDLFDVWAEIGNGIPPTARIIRAGFQVKFTDSRTPRSVVIRSLNVAQYTRDADSELVEDWLGKRGFLQGVGHAVLGVA